MKLDDIRSQFASIEHGTVYVLVHHGTTEPYLNRMVDKRGTKLDGPEGRDAYRRHVAAVEEFVVGLPKDAVFVGVTHPKSPQLRRPYDVKFPHQTCQRNNYHH